MYLSRILRSIRTIATFRKRGIDRVTCCGKSYQVHKQGNCTEQNRTNHLNHFHLLSFFTYRGVVQILRYALFVLKVCLVPGPMG